MAFRTSRTGRRGIVGGDRDGIGDFAIYDGGVSGIPMEEALDGLVGVLEKSMTDMAVHPSSISWTDSHYDWGCNGRGSRGI